MLRIHHHHLARGEAEEGGIKLVDLVNKTAMPDVGLTRRVEIGIVIVSQRPTGGGRFGDRIDAGAQLLPKFGRGIGSRTSRARKAAGHANDGDWLVILC